MSMPATVVYKCRACGGEVLGARVADGLVALAQIRGVSSPLLDFSRSRDHECSPRRSGVAEAVGVQFDAA